MNNLAKISFLVVFITYIIFYHAINKNTNSIVNNIIDIAFIIYATNQNKYYGLLCCVVVLFMKHNKLIEGNSEYNIRNISGKTINVEDITKNLIKNIKQGPAGERGPRGHAGPRGPKGNSGGPTGPTGSRGDIGYTGSIGPTGANGSEGKTGPIGPTGKQGEQGPQGPAGVNTTESFSEYR